MRERLHVVISKRQVLPSDVFSGRILFIASAVFDTEDSSTLNLISEVVDVSSYPVLGK